FRLGDDLAVRMPRRQNSTPQIDKEQRWLPQFAPHLPLAIPTPIARGEPAHGFPWRWSVLRWLEGTDGHATPNADSRDTPLSLAASVTALARIAPADGPPAGPHNFYRGAPLVQRDRYVRRAIAESAREIDAPATTRAWDAALAVSQWHGPPTWLHGD